MTFTTAITGYFSDVVLGLTPLERLEAIPKYPIDAGDNERFIFYGSIIIALLVVLLIIRVYRRKRAQRLAPHRSFGLEYAGIPENLKTGDLLPEDPADQLFAEHAKAKDLTAREYHIMMLIARHARLKRKESIFTLPSAFSRTTFHMIEGVRAEQSLEDSRQFEAELSVLGEKLGFQQFVISTEDSASETTALSSRDIPPKKKNLYQETPSGQRQP